MNAILSCPDLSYNLPYSPESIQDLCNVILQHSIHGALDGCVGALDGYLLDVQAPCNNAVPNVVSFFLVDIKSMGLMSNVYVIVILVLFTRNYVSPVLFLML